MSSRCTPSSNTSWNRRLKRYGGLEGIAAIRTKQFGKLDELRASSLNVVEAARIKSTYGELDDLSKYQLKKATNALDLARLAHEFLTGNARRVLPIMIKEALGWK
jgi:hypothetical protein